MKLLKNENNSENPKNKNKAEYNKLAPSEADLNTNVNPNEISNIIINTNATQVSLLQNLNLLHLEQVYYILLYFYFLGFMNYFHFLLLLLLFFQFLIHFSLFGLASVNSGSLLILKIAPHFPLNMQ